MTNRNAKNMIARAFSMAVAFAATFIITRVIVNKSGNELYGYYAMSADFVNYATVLALALNSMAGRFITVKYYEHDIKGVNRLFNSILYANIILSLVISIPMILIVVNLDQIISINESLILEVKVLFACMFLNYLITIVSSVFSVSTFLKNRVDLDSIRQSESNIIKVCIVYILYYFFAPNIVYLGIGTIIATVYVWLLNVYYVHKLTPEIKIFQRRKPVWGELKELLASGVWNSITRVSSIFLNGLDLFIANHFLGGSALGILSIAKTLPKYFFSAIGTFASVFTPGITIDYAKGDSESLIKRTTISMKFCALISNVIAAVLIVFGKQIYDLWVPGQQNEKIQLITIVAMIGMVVVLPMEPLWAVFTATNKVKNTSLYLISESIISISIVILSLSIVSNELLKLVIIAGISSLFEIIRGIIFMPFYAAKVLHIRYRTFYPVIVRILVAFFVSIVIGLVVTNGIHNGGLPVLIVLLMIFGILFVGINVFIVFSKVDRIYLLNYLKIIRRSSNV